VGTSSSSAHALQSIKNCVFRAAREGVSLCARSKGDSGAMLCLMQMLSRTSH